MNDDADDEEGPSNEYMRTFYSAVGQGISFWASMQGILVCIAAKLLGTTSEKAGLILYSINNFYSWLTIIDELFPLEPKYLAHKAEWGQINARLRSLNDTRVRLAHHTNWDGSAGEGQALLRPQVFDVRSKSKKYAPLDIKEISFFTGDVLRIERSLVVLINAMRSSDSAQLIPFQGKLVSPNPDPPPAGGAQ